MVTSNIYVIELEDLYWISDAYKKFGKKYHMRLMKRWLKDHDVSALMMLMYVGLDLVTTKWAMKQVEEAYNKRIEPTLKSAAHLGR